MPTTRRKSNNPHGVAGSTKAQSTLSFNNKSARVSKPSVQDTTSSGKKAVSKLSEPAKAQIVDEVSVSATEDEDTVKGPAKPKKKEADVTTSETTKTEDIEKDITSPKSPKTKRKSAGSSNLIAGKSTREVEAGKVTDAQIKKYWKMEEDARLAPRVHQSQLPIHEKILRHFDLSSQYGPCIGIPRLNRWKRADTLGLNPPVEVLAVLLREDSKKTTQGCGKLAYIDELGGGRAVLVE